MLERLENRTPLAADGPRIVSLTPTLVVNQVFDHVDVTFDRDINASTFAPNDVAMTGPGGSVAATAVNALNAREFRIAFPALTLRGGYSVTIGPQIADTTNRLMDQNDNGIQAEVPGDQYVATLTYIEADTVFTSPFVITEANNIYEGQNIAVIGTMVTIDGFHEYGSVHLANGAGLTHTANSTTQTHKVDLHVAGEVIVDATSKIDVSGKGYLPGRTSGNTTAGAATNTAAGSHGGVGYPNGYPNAASNDVYGDYRDPDDAGAGPGPSLSGVGGGFVRVSADILRLDGTIIASGTNFGGTCLPPTRV